MDIEGLRFWSKVLLWTSVVLPILAALAAGGRYYIERNIEDFLSEQSRAENAALQSEIQLRKAEIAELEGRTSDRLLTDIQKETMSQILAKAAGTKVTIACKLLDGESCNYAEQFAQVFRTARWVVEPVNKTSLADLPGVVAVYQPFQGSPQESFVLVEALSASGIPHEVGMLSEEETNKHGGNKIFFVVGRKESTPRR